MIYFVGRSVTRKCIFVRGVCIATVVRELAGACDWLVTVLLPSLSHRTIWFAAAKGTRSALSDGAVLQNTLQSQLFYCELHNIKVKVGANVTHLSSVERENKKCVDEANTRTIEVILKSLTTTSITTQTVTRISKNIASLCRTARRLQRCLHRKMIASRSGNGGVSSCRASSRSLLVSPSSYCGEPLPFFAVERSPNSLQMTRNRRSKRRHGRGNRNSRAHS